MYYTAYSQHSAYSKHLLHAVHCTTYSVCNNIQCSIIYSSRGINCIVDRIMRRRKHFSKQIICTQ